MYPVVPSPLGGEGQGKGNFGFRILIRGSETTEWDMSKPLQRQIMLVLVLLIGWVSSSAAQRGFVPPEGSRQGLGAPDAAQLQQAVPFVPGVAPPGDNVSIEGEVLRPGWYPLPLRAEMRLKNLIIQAGGLTKNLDDVRGQVIRVSEAGDLRVFFFSPAEVLKGRRPDNIILQANDRIVIFTVTEETKEEVERAADQEDELSTIERLIAGSRGSITTVWLRPVYAGTP
jgi:hypothetical protein